MIKCPTCKALVKENEKICPYCGEDLPQLQNNRESSATNPPKAPAVTGNGNVVEGGLTTDCNNSYVDSHEVSNVDSHNVTSTVNNTTTNQHTTNINIQLSDGANLSALLNALGPHQPQQPSQLQQPQQPQRSQGQSQVESGKSEGYGISPKAVELLKESNTATASSAPIQEDAESSAQSEQNNDNFTDKGDYKRKHKVLLMVFVALVACGFAYSMLSGSKTEKEAVVEPESKVEETSIQNTIKSPISVQKTAKAVSTAAEKKVAKSSPLEEGEKAYCTGDYATARLAFEEAADEGNAKAAFNLAEMYANAEGVACNLSKAYQYMLKAANGGYAKAYWPLAEMLRNGEGVGANVKEAVKWYKKVVRSDNAHKKQAAELLEILDPDLQ